MFASPNAKSIPLIDAELLSDPAIYPPPDVVGKLEFLRDVGEARAAYDRIWTRLRAGATGG
jgi:spermidine/putrescine transport system substrate-binding protein